ncbi:MAG TPA: hypothetical protein DDW23_01075 [Planctomycetes bacterium]|nr:hypothetical protein [Planctomycetota bacterium]
MVESIFSIYVLLAAIPAVFWLLGINGLPVHRFRVEGVYLFFLVLLIGSRDEIGADWLHYEHQFSRIGQSLEAISETDIGYGLLVYIFHSLGLEIYHLNIFAACFIGFGAVYLSRCLTIPWSLSAGLAVYFWPVVVAGYNRQALSFGALFFGLAFVLRDKKGAAFAAMLVLPLLHISGLVGAVVIAAAIFGFRKKILVGLPLAAGLFLFLWSRLENRIGFYQDIRSMESAGFLLRAIPNLLAAGVYFLLRSRILAASSLAMRRTLDGLSAIALIAFALGFFHSTLGDRLGLYGLILQTIVFFEFLPRLLSGNMRLGVFLLAPLASISLLTYWLGNSVKAEEHWIPYRSVFVEWLGG